MPNSDAEIDNSAIANVICNEWEFQYWTCETNSDLVIFKDTFKFLGWA